jgi:AcrR family transcriptional regulator
MPKRGRPPKITREDILAVAQEIGLQDLTLALVAQKLGVTLPALYYYVNDREQLTDLVAEELVSRYPLPPDDAGDWLDWAFAFAHSQLSMFQEVPGLAQIVMQRTVPSGIARLEQSVRIARRSGFGLTESWWATRAVQEFVFSWAVRLEMRKTLTARTGESYEDYMLRMIAAASEAAPNLDEVLRQTSSQEEAVRFECTLRSLLRGLAHQRDAGLLAG